MLLLRNLLFKYLKKNYEKNYFLHPIWIFNFWM